MAPVANRVPRCPGVKPLSWIFAASWLSLGCMLKTTPRCPLFTSTLRRPHHRYGQCAGLTPVRCRHSRMPHPGDRRTRFLLTTNVPLRSRKRRGTQIQQPKGSYSQVKVRNLLPIQIQRSSDGWVVYYNHIYLLKLGSSERYSEYLAN